MQRRRLDEVQHGPSRQALIDAVIDLTAIVGFRQVAVKDVCWMASVTARTFYRNFSDLVDAFYEACEQMHGEFRDEIQRAYDGASAPQARRAACIDGLIRFVQADPLRADALFVQSYAAGARVAELRLETIEWLLRLLSGHESPPSGNELLSFEMAIGGVNGVICSRIQSGDVAHLSEHAASMVETLRLPEVMRTAA